MKENILVKYSYSRNCIKCNNNNKNKIRKVTLKYKNK